MTFEDLRAIMPNAGRWAMVYADALTDAMHEFDINTPTRQAAFLAQIAEESGELRFVRELWGPTPAQETYEGRADLGNTEPGDGFRFRGRGLIQVTGRANYRETSQALLGDPQFLLDRPEQLEQPVLAARSAARFWSTRGCNALADNCQFERITRRINGGLTHHARRVAHWERAKGVLGV